MLHHGHLGAQPHPVPQAGREGLGHGRHPAVHALLVQAAVAGQHRLEIRTGVDLMQPLDERGLLRHGPERGRVHLAEAPLRAVGAQVRGHPATQILPEPGVVGLAPGRVVAEPLGEPAQAQQPLTQVGDLERRQRRRVLLGGHLKRLSAQPDHQVAAGGQADGLQAQRVDDLEEFVEAGADPLAAQLDVGPVTEHLVLDPAADALPRLQHRDVEPTVREVLRGNEPSQPSPDDGAVEHGVPPRRIPGSGKR